MANMLLESPTRPGWTFILTRHRGDFGPIWRRSPLRVWVGVTVTGLLLLGLAWAVWVGIE